MQDGDTALIYAVRESDVDSVKLLVQHGAAVDIRNKVTISTAISRVIKASIQQLGRHTVCHQYTTIMILY